MFNGNKAYELKIYILYTGQIYHEEKTQQPFCEGPKISLVGFLKKKK
jgi:hypothetical protein